MTVEDRVISEDTVPSGTTELRLARWARVVLEAAMGSAPL